MFMHIGGDVVISTKEVIAIIDISFSDGIDKKIQDYLERVEKEHNVDKIGNNEELKSLIITTGKMFYSPISSYTLKRRANIFFSQDNYLNKKGIRNGRD